MKPPRQFLKDIKLPKPSHHRKPFQQHKPPPSGKVVKEHRGYRIKAVEINFQIQYQIERRVDHHWYGYGKPFPTQTATLAAIDRLAREYPTPAHIDKPKTFLVKPTAREMGLLPDKPHYKQTLAGRIKRARHFLRMDRHHVPA